MLFVPIPRLLLFIAGFFAFFVVGHFALQALNHVHPFDCPHYWPLSIFNFRDARPEDLGRTGLLLAALALALPALFRRRFPLPLTLTVGLLLVFGINGIGGVPRGFETPIDGGRKFKSMYYRDALPIKDAGAFLRTFNVRQPRLRVHSRTHPPGAVLLPYALRQVFGDAIAWQAVVMALFSTLVGGAAFYRLLQTLGHDDEAAGYGTLLLFCLPAVNIYFCASIDGVLCALALATLAAHRGAQSAGTQAVATIAFALASFFSFGTAALAGGVIAIDLARRTLHRSVGIFAATAALFLVLKLGWGYDHLAALTTASRLENIHGPRFLWQPYVYAMTRLEDIAEPILFFGPLPFLLLLQGISRIKRWPREDRAVALAIPLATLALFVTGAYHTGETARACLFVTPCLLTIVLHRLPLSRRPLLLILTLAQTVLMQLFGNFFW
jgi:hypothetical protein